MRTLCMITLILTALTYQYAIQPQHMMITGACPTQKC